MNENDNSIQKETAGITYFDKGIQEGSDGKRYQRYAVKTHFVQVGESHVELVKRYVSPLYQPGDVLSFGAKVMAMTTKNVHTRDDIKPGFFANLMWRFATSNSTGIGMHEPYKLQLVINVCGLPRVLFAAFVSAITRPFGIKGLFYKICGKGIAGIDGFYERSDFDIYKNMALVNPPNAKELCDEIFQKTGIPTVLMDANDFDRNILDVSTDCPLTETQIQEAMRDNPSGQGAELTPLILIRPL